MSQATLQTTPYHNANLFAGYYLDERVDDLDAWDCDEAAQEAFEELQELWEIEGSLLASYNEDELLDIWIEEVLDALGFGMMSETTLPGGEGYNDRLLFESGDTRRGAALQKKKGDAGAMYNLASAVLEAKQWNADFGQRFAENRSYYDASQQIKYYLDKTPEGLRWGILTDGRKWRLYGTKDYATETYYEVDLPELLESGDLEAFKYFYVFFRPEAFAETAGTSFLDTVWSESETAAQELGSDLQDNVFTALRVLGEGFVATNDLDIDPDDEAALTELKEQSLVLLYRLMFVLYAESRDLIHPESTEQVAEYEENFSLTQLRSEIHDEISAGEGFDTYSEYSTTMWNRLGNLFDLVDEGNEELGIPPYNGGLFDDENHAFLAEHEVADRYVAEVVYRLGTTETDGSFVLADYADLDTRHLGSIYEGLLEHEFHVAPEEYAAVAADGGQVWKPATEVSVADAVETVEAGGLYVVNDDGERKATGAYYTPDYVVSYIVEETVDPLLEDIRDDLAADGLEPGEAEYFRRFWQSVLDLKILDPAMGSAHFLTSATGYLTEQVMEVVREQEIQSYDEQDLRRTIAKECIYGVDINGMAVELGKLSMWLETLAADQPLAFLDHHLKTGNSLVGSDITEVLSDGDEEAAGQLTLFEAFDRTRRRTLDHVMDRMQELLDIDNETLADIHSMEEIYDDIRADPLYQRLFELANVHTAEAFGLDVPEDAYQEMAGAIEDDEEWAEIAETDWFQSAQATAEEEAFFHWELEFPEVFFDIDGEVMEEAGFDAVVGNPPWLNAWEMAEEMPQLRDAVSTIYSNYEELEGHWDYFVPFSLLGMDLTKDSGQHSYIVPNLLLTEKYTTNIRKKFIQENRIDSVLSFGERNVFENVERQCVVYVLSNRKDSKHSLRQVTSKSGQWKTVVTQDDNIWEESYNYQIRVDSEYADEILPLVKKIINNSVSLGQYLYVNVGATVSSKSGKFKKQDVVSAEPTGNAKEFFQGRNVERWLVDWDGEWLDYKIDEMSGPRTPEMFESNKIIIRKRTNKGGILAVAYDDSGMYCDDTVLVCCSYDPLEGTGATINFDDYERINYDFDIKTFISILNSTLITWVFKNRYETGGLQGSYSDVWPDAVRSFPVPSKETLMQSKLIESEENNYPYQVLSQKATDIQNYKRIKKNLNLSLLDHLGAYSEGPTLSEIGLTQPPEGAADSILQRTTEEHPNLRVGDCEVVRESSTTVEIRLTARYKPEEAQLEDTRRDDYGGDDPETDRWGYAETEPLPALRVTDLTETEADLVEAFVPVAVEEAGGFAEFRETATKTNSLVDRLRKLTLPAVADVAEGLASYRETKARAEELEAKIERTDDLIDEIVYELYGLTDEEIEIVEEAVGE